MNIDNFEQHSQQFFTLLKRESTNKNHKITFLDEPKTTTFKKQNLSPEMKPRKEIRPFSEDRSRYTENKIYGLEHQMKTLGLIEARKYNNNHSKTITNFDNFDFATDREKTKLAKFYQKTNDNDQEPIGNKNNSKFLINFIRNFPK